ncbi:glycosyltransferase family 8 protein [Helicobacter pylori]|uniref:glycosyltransferase family 8 protein n=1 Tax=Helicobacter pylori TaxID=210 RepID=UPI00112E3246|nr:glycosyltransferase family 8 protein [Helicobacter pylori]TPH82369.1 glycosyltransferase family 8 protein [Helicobacter pylori]TPH89641.1 glycosyltransferase family 8 protein [Helicobacter pylori]
MTSTSSHSFKEQDFHIPIAFAFDKDYLIPAGACIYSLLESIAKANKKIRYTLHALVVGLNEEDKAKLHQIAEPFKEFAALEVKDIEPFLDTIPNPFDEDFTKRFSKMVLVKYFLADLFPKYSKMVWSDVDVIFCNEFSVDFLNIKEEDENYFHGVLEVRKHHMMEGFLFCNLDYQRKKNFTLRMHDLLKGNETKEELDFTKWCWPNMKALGIEYCVFPLYYTIKDFSNAYLNENYKKTILEVLKNPIVIHYDAWWGAVKPWDYPFGLKADLWLNALAKTPFMSDWIDSIARVEIGSEKWHRYHSIVAYHYYFPLWKTEEQIAHDALKTFLDHYFSCIHAAIKQENLGMFLNHYFSHAHAEIKENSLEAFLNHYFSHVYKLPKNARKKLFRVFVKHCILIPFKSLISKTLKILGLHVLAKKILIQLKLLKKS